MFDLLSPPRIDEWTAQLQEREAEIAGLRSEQAALVQRLGWFHVAERDGARSMLEWTTATLDVDEATARKLAYAARFLGRNRRLVDAAAAGDFTSTVRWRRQSWSPPGRQTGWSPIASTWTSPGWVGWPLDIAG